MDFVGSEAAGEEGVEGFGLGEAGEDAEIVGFIDGVNGRLYSCGREMFGTEHILNFDTSPALKKEFVMYKGVTIALDREKVVLIEKIHDFIGSFSV